MKSVPFKSFGEIKYKAFYIIWLSFTLMYKGYLKKKTNSGIIEFRFGYMNMTITQE